MNIVDLNGKIIYSTSIQGSEIIDLSGFESGVYFVKIGSVSQKTIRR